LALYFSLSRADRGYSLIGTVLTIAGIGIILANVSNPFFFFQEGMVSNTGKSPNVYSFNPL
jgi:hypothetical protein